MKITKILLLTDGECHTSKAENYALTLARALSADLFALYVIDPFLKKFTDEIYAVNRDQCREHLDKKLAEEGGMALSGFSAKALAAEVPVKTMLLYGNPEKVVAELVGEDYDLVILGAKHLEGWWQRFESCNLPGKIFRSVNCPLLFVK